MSKIIFASQRVDVVKDYNERRDALDQMWAKLFYQLDILLQPVANHKETVKLLLDKIKPDGILLTGGNNPLVYNGTAPERDEIDTLLIEWAIKNQKPLLGVCRGMQSIVLYFGGTLKKIEGHIAIKHNIKGEMNREVNSYHSLAVDIMPKEFRALAKSDDGEIEGVRHNTLLILGIMWHPERVQPFSEDDIKLIKNLYI